jgi:glucose/arabinose dehydrogenase/cytochrome c553
MKWNSFRLIICLGIFACFAGCKQTGLPPGDPGNGGLFLPEGFEAMVVADSVPGASRHIAVNSNGDIYVRLRFISDEGGNAALRDVDGDGKIDSVKIWADFTDKGQYGTEMRVHDGYLWYSSVTHVYRQKLTPGELVPQSPMELMLTDTQPPRSHDTKPIAFDKKGNMYIPFGAPSDCCQVSEGAPFSPGKDPCPLLEHRGGIWKFDASKPNQFQQDGERFATGFRSIVAIAWNNADDNLYTIMHGRDYLHWNWPMHYTEVEGAILPSEEFLRIRKGDNAGWPYAYWDHIKGKKMQSPEYGGDGKTEAKDTSYVKPVVGFPGHFAPNDLLFYSGDQFPERYRNGAFFAFHGSTSSAPYPQSGYIVAFVPFKDGNPSGPWELFADGFAGVDTVRNTSDAKYRPMGLSEGPDGSLYVSDSEKGKIWRIMFKGDREKFGAQALAAMVKRKAEAPNTKMPDEVKDNLDRKDYSPAARTYNTYCAKCHERNGEGNSRFPPLKGSEWLAGSSIKQPLYIVLNGMEVEMEVRGRKFINRMPSFANVLSDEQIADILTYIKTEFNDAKTGVSVQEVGKIRKELHK